MKPLEKIKLPTHLSPAEACRLACFMTGHKQLKAIDKYLALSMLNVSWRSTAAFSLKALLLKLMLMQRDTNFQLLESLAIRDVYEEAGKAADQSEESVQAAYEAAERWCRQLSTARPPAKELHLLAIAILESLLDEEPELQRESVVTIQKITSSSMQRNQANEDSASVAVEAAKSVNDAAEGQAARNIRLPNEALMMLLASVGRAAPVKAFEPAMASQNGGGLLYKVFDPEEAARMRDQVGPAMFGEGNQKQSRLLEMLSADPGMRSLVTIEHIEEKLVSLESRFPHFKEVLDFIKSSLYLASCGSGPGVVRVPPILLRGDPGAGKSYFAEELAKALSAPYVERDLSVTSEAFVLVGQDSTWKNSKPGLVFDALVGGQFANPVICLNEVDKVKVTGFQNSPMSALYGLLEPSSAKCFKDEFVPVPLDASRVVWIMTANDGEIPEPILSRVEVFDIPEPTREQMQQIAKSIWKGVRESELPDGNTFPDEMCGEVLDALPSVSPRVLRKLLISAAAYACMPGGDGCLTASGIQEAAIRYAKHAAKTKLGFV